MSAHARAIAAGPTSLAEALLASHWALLGAVVLVLVPLSFQHYLLFHTLAEIVSIVIAVAAFAVAWSAYPFSRNHFLMWIGIVLFWTGALDLMHTLLYKGMNIFESIDANPATEVWIATRYLQAAGFLVAPFFLTRSLRPLLAFALVGVVAIALLVLIQFLNVFPAAYVEGVGMTPFKIASEYIIVGIFALAVALLWSRQALIDRTVLLIVSGAIGLLICAELAFTLYVDVYGISNLAGHVLKVSGYWLLYWALVGFTVEQPFRTMARTASTYDAVPEAIVVVDPQGIVREANRTALAAAPRCIGADCHEQLHPAQLARGRCPICIALGEGNQAGRIEVESADRWYEFTLSPIPREKGARGMVQVRRDVTDRRRAALLLEESERRLRALTEHSSDLIAVLDAEGVLRYASASVAQIGGYRPEEVIGRNFLDFVHPDDVDQARRDVSALLRHPQEPVEAELRFRHRNGSWIVFASVSTNAISDPAVRGIVVNARDVTRRKADELRMLEHLDELRRFQKVSIGRELRMQQLQGEIQRLELELAAVRAHG